ncbi:adhesion G-protein coupled receptor G6-like [Lytechinus pictus]|uniref:adhesion G-protein coupled receptor G6-like n=1 Tax=Lytechinus pictus TaxID=7653 RepID=UPI0030B9F4B7
MLVGGGLGLGGDVPTIINTRNGSMIVDYQATFSNANGTDLIEGVTTALRDNLDGSDATPRDLILDSITVGSVSACPESVYVGSEGTFTFPSVGLGQISESVEHCPVYTGNTPVPRARRTCLGDFITQAYWADPVPSECFDENDNTNQVLDDIANAPISRDNVTEYSSDLAKVTNDTSSITADGLESIATSLENIVRVQDSSMEVTVNVINTINNVLQVSDEDFVIAIDAEAPTRILDSLEDQLTLFQTQGDGSNLTVVDDSIAVAALNIPRTTVQGGIGFGSQSAVGSGNNVYNEVLGENSTMVFFDLDAMPINEFEAVVILPSGILDSISSGESMVPITFFVFQNSRLFQSGNQQNTLEPGRRQAVGSRVISATIEGFDVQTLPMGEEIETAFLELNVTDDDETVDNRSCVFWEKTTIGGQWSTRGCRREDLPEVDRIRCLCDHLTSFAVLLDVSGDIDIFVLDILSMIGCGISSLCLVILLITFICVKKLRSSQPQRIHINLCLALLGLYLDFLVGIDLRYPTIGCVIAGFILHFFLLSSMAWMLVEAVYMYILFVNVHSGTVSKYIRTSSVLAWGSPLIVCIIIVCIDREFYLGDNTYCFVQPGPVLYYSVLLPVAAIVLINTIIFILVAYRLTCGRWTISANKSTGEDKRSETWRRLQNLVAFTILLGLTWAFGFLAIGGARFVFNVLFLVFNSLQGLFIFIMFGLRQKPVRDEWLRFFRCQCCEDEKSRRSRNYMKSRPLTGGKSSGQTESSSAGIHGSAIPLDGRGLSSTTSRQLP